MLTTPTLDLAALRTFVTAVDLGGFGKAAARLHRTPGAVSLQLKALEQRLDRPLFQRDGKRQQLTPAGETLLGHARRLLAANDDAMLALRGLDASGDVRLGMPQDLADRWLPTALGRVARAYPRVRIQLRVGRSAELRDALDHGELDLAIAFGRDDAATPDQTAGLDVHWWGHADLARVEGTPVPLLLLDTPCLFRDAALRALEKTGTAWRIAMSSGSVSALWAAAAAGLGITPRTALGVPTAMRTLDAAWHLPPLPRVGLHVHVADGAQHPIVDYLRGLVHDAVEPGASA